MVWSPSKELGSHFKSVANFVSKNLIVFELIQAYIKIFLKFKDSKFVISFSVASAVDELLTIWWFFTLKNCKICLGLMLPPGDRNWQLILTNWHIDWLTYLCEHQRQKNIFNTNIKIHCYKNIVPNKLESLSMASFSPLVQCLLVWPEPTQVKHLYDVPIECRLLVLSTTLDLSRKYYQGQML